MIVFNNLLASFVQITSFLPTFRLRCLVFEVVMLIPLCGRSISQREGCEAEEGVPSLPPRMTAARRGDALVVKVWERVGASNPRWCRPFSYLLILRGILALLAGFPLGWLASDSSLLIPESQRLPPSCRGRRGDTSRPFAQAIEKAANLKGESALPPGAAKASSYLRRVCGGPYN